MYSELHLDAGVLHDHLINHTNKNKFACFVLERKKNHQHVCRCKTDEILSLWLISDVINYHRHI